MNTMGYRGWWIHETFLHSSQMALSHENGIRVVSPKGETIHLRTKLVDSAKRFIRRRDTD